MLDLNLEELNQMPVELFVERVRKENFIPSYLQAFAQIMHETANSYSLKGNESTAQVFYIKTLQLYYLLNEKDRTFSFERELIITELNKIII